LGVFDDGRGAEADGLEVAKGGVGIEEGFEGPAGPVVDDGDVQPALAFHVAVADSFATANGLLVVV
jgi:hypothetical protein